MASKIKRDEVDGMEAGPVSRKRLGEWERFTSLIAVPGCRTPVPAPQIRVTFRGHEWVVGDTAEGRKTATDGIHEVLRHEGRIRKVDRARELVAEATADLAGEVLAVDPGLVLATLDDLIGAMRGEKKE